MPEIFHSPVVFSPDQERYSQTESAVLQQKSEKNASVQKGPLAIELQAINKRFGAVHANKDVTLEVQQASIHGIVGENGAGKSTLMSILYGFYEADSGQILIEGKPVSIRNSKHAINAGIGMVHQHFMLVEPFTVLENVMLGAEQGSLLKSASDHARETLHKISQDYGLHVDPDTKVEDLPVGLQQRVEILKALYRGAKILILDEPTGVLTPQEADQLFDIVRALKKRGVTTIIITHKLREIMDVTDRVSVMRRGEIVANVETAQTSPAELAELMVGRKVLLDVSKKPANPGDVKLSLKKVSLTDRQGVHRLKEVSFDVRAGEIVGIAGVSGNGQSKLLEILTGMERLSSGSVSYLTSKGSFVQEPKAPLNATQFRNLGAAHVPENRLRQGLVKTFSAKESAVLGYEGQSDYGRFFLNMNAITNAAEQMMEAYDVRPPNPDLKSANFSGGNQQKLILAREMLKEPEILIVAQPTRGVDIGAIEFIHRNIIKARDSGAAVLLVSAELDEVMSLSDRILVIFDGSIVGDLPASDADEKTLGLMMANAYDEE